MTLNAEDRFRGASSRREPSEPGGRRTAERTGVYAMTSVALNNTLHELLA